MSNDQRFPHLVTAVFAEVAPFREVLRALVGAGFDHTDVSVLAPHRAVADHFDGVVPAPPQLADRSDTPRRDLEPETTVEAVVHAIAEGLSVIGTLGAAGAAYAVGGPVGVASGAGAAVETSVEEVLDRFVGGGHVRRFKENLADGGLVVWVRVRDRAAAERARGLLERHGGRDIHAVPAPPLDARGMAQTSFQPRRSLIFMPGDKPEMFAKALRTGADMVCVDLEDAVAPRDKAAARAHMLALFAEPQADDGVERIVRINCLRTADGLRDVSAILDAALPPPALMMTKVKTADEVRLLDELLSEGPHAAIRLHVIVETNDGLDAAFDIAGASPRTDSLLFGAVDMAAELRAEASWETLLYARSRLVHAAAGAGIDLIDVPFLDLDDERGLEAEAARAAALGFTGKGAIHPRQVPVINRRFSPTPEAVERARRIVAAFEESATGLVVVDGKLIERPVLRSMARLVAIAERIAEVQRGREASGADENG
jgi:citrate lyase beta subunit